MHPSVQVLIQMRCFSCLSDTVAPHFQKVHDDSLSTRGIDKLGSSIDCQRQRAQESNISWRKDVRYIKVLGKR